MGFLVGGNVTNVPNILYEDNHLIVAVKPVNVLSQSDGSNTQDMLTLLKTYIKEKYNKPGNVFLGLVHRLDKEVSGVMVFARTSKAASRLSEQVRTHKFDKRYVAVCKGIFREKSGVMVDYLKRLNFKSEVSNSKEGKLAKLSYNVIAESDDLSLVDIHLQTGRHHQIRVQFSSRNHPLLGDKKYYKEGKFPLALMAYSLSFDHPISKETLSFNIPVFKQGYFKSFY